MKNAMSTHTFSATPGYENCPKIGFVAHLDTVSDFCDKKIVPVVTENYDGRDLPLAVPTTGSFCLQLAFKGSQRSYFDHQQRRYDPRCRRQSRSCRDHDYGRTSIDRKIPHGPISIGFTPDEEVGRGAGHFD